MATLKSRLLATTPLREGALSIISLLLRLGVSASMLTHGVAKVMNFSTLSEGFPDPLGIGSTLSLLMAIGAEVGCSLFLMLGLLTRLALLPLMFTMVIASCVVLGGEPFAAREMAVVYLSIYIAIFAIGAGRYSIDNLIK